MNTLEKPPRAKSHIPEPLEAGELLSLEALALRPDQEYLKTALDMFLTACYTGLRFMEIAELRKEHIIKVEQSSYIDIEFYTGRKVMICIADDTNNKQLVILQHHAAKGRRFIFDTISEHELNRDLRQIAKSAGIERELKISVACRTHKVNKHK